MRRPFARLASTDRSFPGDQGIPYWQTLAIGAVLVLVVLSLVLYVLGSPSPWAMLVLGILIGGAVVGNSGRSSAPTHMPGHRHGDGRCVYSDGPVARCVFPEDSGARAAWQEGQAHSAHRWAAPEPEIEDDDWFSATDAKSVLDPAYRAAQEREAATSSTPAAPVAERGPALTLLARLELAAANPAPVVGGEWRCPIHDKPGIPKTSQAGREYIGCPDCHAFSRG